MARAKFPKDREAMILSSNIGVSTEVVTIALKKGFNKRELELMVDLVKTKVSENLHNEMWSTCEEISDSDGADHHSSETRFAERELKRSYALLKRFHITVNFVQVSRKTVRRWKFTKQTSTKKATIEISAANVEFS